MPHLILPPTSALNHDHYDLIFNAFAVRNVTRYNTGIWKRAETTNATTGKFFPASARAWPRSSVANSGQCLARTHHRRHAAERRERRDHHRGVFESLTARHRSRSAKAVHGDPHRNARQTDRLRARADAGRHGAIQSRTAASPRLPACTSSAAATYAATIRGCTIFIASSKAKRATS